MKNILLTCPPMINRKSAYQSTFDSLNWKVTVPEFQQTVSESELVSMIDSFDGWLIGDDPASRKVFEKGSSGRLRAAVKWGIGVDNIDFAAAEEFGIRISNTPGMFGAEVADLAMHYLVGLARETFQIDRSIRSGQWPKPAGRSLSGRRVGLLGFGDIGRNFVKRAIAADMRVTVYDPVIKKEDASELVEIKKWPEDIGDCDFIVLTCALTPSSYHILNAETLALTKAGVQIVNVARGALINQPALNSALQSGHVHSAALDVFEIEPLPENDLIRTFPNCILGSHNGSNTIEAVDRASKEAIYKLNSFFS